MTVIIGSLFLPYTAQFEVGPQEDEYTEVKHEPSKRTNRQSHSGSTRPVGILQSSLLPSLSIANSHQQSPTSSSPGQFSRSRNNSTHEPASVEDFFLQRHSKGDPQGDVFAENLSEKLRPHYIQPKSTFNRKIDSSVVEKIKANDDLGLPSLKISRSGTSLASLNNTPSPSSTNAGVSRAHATLGRSGLSMSLLNNSSTSLIDPITEEDEHEDLFSQTYDSDDNDWDNDFNKIINPRSKIKLAPFGGFSNPILEKGVMNKSNVFETSPWKIMFALNGNGSLIKAVKLAVTEGNIKKRRWVGTLSMPSDEVPDHVMSDIAKTLKEDYHSEAVFPSDVTFYGHYKSFCKQVLWPTFHYEIPDNPKSKVFEDHSWTHYKALNQMIADKIVEVYKQENGDLDPDDPENMIWIHDYHLLLAPQMIREKLPNAKIGFFLHVSFPSSEVFRCLAQREALLKGMLGANSISFQTEEYVRHFLQTCTRLLLADANEYGMTYDGRFTMVNTIPVGIDANSLNETLQTEEVLEWRRRIRDRWSNQRLIVSRDKLDKLRGIKEKLLAYERFLQKHPSYIHDTVLIQVCTGSASDEDYALQVMQIANRINALSPNLAISQPVVLLQQDIAFEQYLALEIESDLFVVSSMREGLNLTCHEFIVASNEKKSPLMLSEFTGSSHILSLGGHGALLINPWDINKFSEVFYKLLTMDPNEKLSRWRACHEVITHHDSKNWIKGCLMSINDAWRLNEERSTINLRSFNSSVFKKFYQADGTKLYFINLETSSAISSILDNKAGKLIVSAKTSESKNSDIIPPTHIARLLSDLLNDPTNKVYLCSYLKRLTLDTMFKRLPSLGLIAENGGYIKVVGCKQWISIVNESDVANWMPQVKQLVEAKIERLPGSKADFEDCTVIFNPGKSFLEDRSRSIDLMGDLIQHVNEIFNENDGVHASLIRNTVVVQQNQLGLRALHFLVDFYNNNSVNDFKPREINDSSSSTPIKEKKSPLDFTSDGTVKGLFISGGTTIIDEPNFDYGNNLKEEGIIQSVLTVAALNNDCKGTSAKYGVSGRNELLSIISTSVKSLHE